MDESVSSTNSTPTPAGSFFSMENCLCQRHLASPFRVVEGEEILISKLNTSLRDGNSQVGFL